MRDEREYDFAIRGLGRWRSPVDERDEAYRVGRILGADLAEAAMDDLPTYKYHRVVNPRLHQGQTSQCTIFSHKTNLLTGPNVLRPSHTELEMYRWTQENDPWPGSEWSAPYYEGTATRTSGQAMVHFGYATGFYWVRVMEELIRRLQVGPVVVGMTWREGMSNPDNKFFMRDAGEIQGGHQMAISGYNLRERKLRWPQTWGMGWADRGMCWSTFDFLYEKLESGDAEVMALAEVAA